VQAGLGIINMTDYLLVQHIAAGRMLPILPEWSIDPLPVHIVYPQNRHLSAKVRVFVEWVSELFAAHPNLRLQPPRTVAPSSAAAMETV
jgi:LysR family transcriptional regulator for bpeEF and oprC